LHVRHLPEEDRGVLERMTGREPRLEPPRDRGGFTY
jgi:hypothetical protein